MGKNPKIFTKQVADELNAWLKQFGFKRSGFNFSLVKNDLVLFIQIQSSNSSNAETSFITVNLGIVSSLLCKLKEVDKPTIHDSDWRMRIGHLLDPPMDKWWRIEGMDSTAEATTEILALLDKKAIPKMFEFKSTDDLKTLWLNGGNQGLTALQVRTNLQLLEHSLN